MVVLEDGGMMTTNPNQYLQPDYLSPLPSSVSCLLCLEKFMKLFNFRQLLCIDLKSS